jgi:hypothetical protein
MTASVSLLYAAEYKSDFFLKKSMSASVRKKGETNTGLQVMGDNKTRK